MISYGIRIMQGAPNQYYYVTILRRNIDLIDHNNVEVGMYFTTVDDGLGSSPPCIGNICPTSIEKKR